MHPCKLRESRTSRYHLLSETASAAEARSTQQCFISHQSQLQPRQRPCMQPAYAPAVAERASNSDSAAMQHHQSPSMQPAPAQFQSWHGLRLWRAKGVDRRRVWGETGATHQLPVPGDEQYQAVELAGSLVECAVQVLNTACPRAKAALTHRAWEQYSSGKLPLFPLSIDAPLALPDWPARPEKPELVPAKQVPSYQPGVTLPLSAYMLHNLAHIELNAIDLAWDTVARFAHLQLPREFYEDFARVADDESRHLGWCLQRLHELGHDYGDMVAHALLWEGAQASAGDLNARLAIVPMSQEARGLDAGQRLVQRLVGSGDKRSAAIVQQIAEEELAHVATGVLWFHKVCEALQLEGAAIFRQWLAYLCPDLLKGPFNHEARNAVGLQRDWYDTKLWPTSLLEHTVTPAKAASLRGQGHKPNTSDSLSPPLLADAQLRQLHDRLHSMVQQELRSGYP